jgi:VanZ family protein
MASIFFMSSGQPPEPAKHAPIFLRIKLTHFIEYAVLNLLIFFAIRTTTRIPYSWQAVYAVFLTYIYGLTDELHQVFVLGRSASFIDSFTNLAAAVTAQAVIWAAIKHRSERLKK